MFQNLIFVMSLSGSIVCLLYIVTYPLAKRYFPLKWRYFMLKTAVIFFLVPFPECKYYISGAVGTYFPALWEKIFSLPGVTTTEDLIIVGRDSITISPKTKCVLIIMLIMGITAFVILCEQAVQYSRMKKICLGVPLQEMGRRQRTLFFKIKDELHMKRKVRFVCSEACMSPMTSGVLSPVVIFPVWENDEMDDDMWDSMIRHELLHIKHQDLMVKLLGVLVMAVHWFNPFSYFLYHEISTISEMYSDSEAMQGKGREERCRYGRMIVKLASEKGLPGRGRFFSGAAESRNKIVYRRRILEIMGDRKHKVVLAAVMVVSACMAGGITTFAYEPPNIYVDRDFEKGEELIVFEGALERKWQELPSNYFFINENEDIYDLNDANEGARAGCKHQYVSGTMVTHNKSGDGGCTITEYEAQRCNACGAVVKGKLLQTIISPKCTH